MRDVLSGLSDGVSAGGGVFSLMQLSAFLLLIAFCGKTFKKKTTD